MSKINTGNRSKAEDQKALDDLIQEVTAVPGTEIVEENGAKFVVTYAFGLPVKTRIA